LFREKKKKERNRLSLLSLFAIGRTGKELQRFFFMVCKDTVEKRVEKKERKKGYALGLTLVEEEGGRKATPSPSSPAVGGRGDE